MAVVLIYAALLCAAVLISSRAERSVLSTAVLFLVGGILLGNGGLHWIHFEALSPIVETITTVALFSVLFTDGMHIPLADFHANIKLPARALLIGLPITLIGNTVLAHFVAGLAWLPSLMAGAALAPTDPVFASALMNIEQIPARIRHMLNLESGMNDGLALPVLLYVLGRMTAHPVAKTQIAYEVVGGIAIGLIVPWIVLKLEASPFFEASKRYRPLNAVSAGLLVYGICQAAHMNLFLAAFAAGFSVILTNPDACRAFSQFGELISELIKLLAILTFASLVGPRVLADVNWRGYLFCALVLLAVRPVAMICSFANEKFTLRDWLTISWFGPKGFSSVAYGLLIFRSNTPEARVVAHLIAITVTASIVAHSSTDILFARWYKRAEAEAKRSPEQQPNAA